MSIDDLATMSVCSPLPVWGEGWGEGDTERRKTLTPHPTPLPMGEWIDTQRQKIS
jgi:hypothetical protein